MKHGFKLVDYQDSSDTDDEEQQAKKKFENPLKKIKLENSIETEVHVDDPALHDHRTRSFAHVRGNWASHIYLELLDNDFHALQDSILEAFAENEVKKIENPHLSVSKVFTLQYHWIPSFVQGLQKRLHKSIDKFHLSLGSKLQTFVNEDQSRTFIALQIPSSENLLKIVQICDETLLEFNKDPFYQPPEFHISLAWTLGKRKIDLSKLDQVVQDWLEDSEKVFEIDQIHAKIGNKSYNCNFKKI